MLTDFKQRSKMSIVLGAKKLINRESELISDITQRRGGCDSAAATISLRRHCEKYNNRDNIAF